MSTDRIPHRNTRNTRQITMSSYALDVGGELNVASFVTNAITANSRDQLGLLVSSEHDSAVFAVSDTDDKPAIDASGGRGVGILASGQTAALQLGLSGAQPGPPSGGFHSAGMLYLDLQADLYLCKVSGDPGVWKLLG
ncbi:hypothetical protein ACTVZO_07380 [Streptomyces sp. IBSNAI002]|uniref:hypothetical protein n=1 Tax=Streptomyces sp. IBSNAI002 TaxID=3457500 RepID=UPI003FD2E71B